MPLNLFQSNARGQLGQLAMIRRGLVTISTMKWKIALSIVLTSIGVAATLIWPDDPMASLWPRSEIHAPGKGKVLDIAIKELGNFDYDPDDPDRKIPADVVQLNGSKIRLRGFMMPFQQTGDMERFLLVPSLTECCFGQPPSVQHTVVVTASKEKAVRYYSDEITVEGELGVKETTEEEYVVSLFEVSTTKIIPPKSRR